MIKRGRICQANLPKASMDLKSTSPQRMFMGALPCALTLNMSCERAKRVAEISGINGEMLYAQA
jgi:hypothetical protein